MTPQGHIRRALPEDVPEILQLVRELADYEKAAHEVVATEQMMSEALFGPSPAVFCNVVEHLDGDRRLGGLALWFLNFSTWTGRHGIYLEDLFVRPQLRGRGYGKALLASLARVALERGYTRFEWSVLDWNRPAWAFYESIGAVPMDEWTVHRVSGAALHELGDGAS